MRSVPRQVLVARKWQTVARKEVVGEGMRQDSIRGYTYDSYFKNVLIKCTEQTAGKQYESTMAPEAYIQRLKEQKQEMKCKNDLLSGTSSSENI
jgi:hypothetical protein